MDWGSVFCPSPVNTCDPNFTGHHLVTHTNTTTSGFQLSVKSNQTIAKVLVLLRFEIA